MNARREPSAFILSLTADIEGVDSDLDLDAMKDSDSDEEPTPAKRKYTRRAKVSDFPERAAAAAVAASRIPGAPRGPGRPPKYGAMAMVAGYSTGSGACPVRCAPPPSPAFLAGALPPRPVSTPTLSNPSMPLPAPGPQDGAGVGRVHAHRGGP